MEKSVNLQQFLKLKGIVSTGGEAKLLIQNSEVKVNGKIEKRRGKKLEKGDEIEVNRQIYLVEDEG